MRQITAFVVLLGVAAGAFAGPKMPAKGMKKMTAAQCSAACTQHMKAKGMKGSCPVSACKNGTCPMMSKSGHMGKMGGMGMAAPKAPAKKK